VFTYAITQVNVSWSPTDARITSAGRVVTHESEGTMYGGTTILTISLNLVADNKREYDEAVDELKVRISRTLPTQRVQRDTYSPKHGRHRKTLATLHGTPTVSERG
jgi:hypothetical protein